jgi:hypothetical protein
VVSFFALKRLRISSESGVAYDERFHPGVNIIRGENSSGKSTISDFIFYGLGGEFDRWKDAAAQCSAVHLEIATAESTLTVYRNVGGKQEPVLLYYGGMDESLSTGIDSWQRLPIRRPPSGKDLSFTQVLFRAAGIPEAPNIGNSNITMHQVLRLLYADQQTPAGKLFRFESFDTREIRDAVGQLLIGINGYELYEGQIKLRELKSAYFEKDQLYKAALIGLPSSEGLTSIATLEKRIAELFQQKGRILKEIGDVDVIVGEGRSDNFVAERRTMQARLRRLAKQLNMKEQRALDLSDENDEITQFLDHLTDQMAVLDAAEDLSDKLKRDVVKLNRFGIPKSVCF